MNEVRGIERWKHRTKQLKVETYALYLAYKDPRVSWYAEVFAACVVGYAFSPIDLIPDFIPVLGYLDDLVLAPLGITLVLKMIPRNWVAAGVIIAIWLLLIALVITVLVRTIKR